MKKWMLTLLCLILCLSCIALAEGETPEREERTSGDYTYILMDNDAAFDDWPTSPSPWGGIPMRRSTALPTDSNTPIPTPTTG